MKKSSVIVRQWATLVLLAIAAAGNLSAQAQTSAANAEAGDGDTVAMATPAAPAPYENPTLNCLTFTAQTPHLKLVAKTKQDDRYGRIGLGCIALTAAGELLTPEAESGLDIAVDYLLSHNGVIRLYIDIAAPDVADDVLETRFRRQAFAVKKFFTGRGVFGHLKKNREGEFPPSFDDPEPETQVAEKPMQAAPKPKPARKRVDTEKVFAFHADRADVLYISDNPSMYASPAHTGFQFIPLDSIYFTHDGDRLTDRARATLDYVAQYILDHPATDRLIIRSHADHTGTVRYNFKLTDRRALAVRDYLQSRGVHNALLEIISKGERDPVDEHWTRQGQARNRRVELFMVQRSAGPAAGAVAPMLRPEAPKPAARTQQDMPAENQPTDIMSETEQVSMAPAPHDLPVSAPVSPQKTPKFDWGAWNRQVSPAAN